MIEIKNVTKEFSHARGEHFHALKNINLHIGKNEFVILQGISGSGKSTLLSIIGAIMKPSSGAVEIDNQNIVSLSDYHASEYRKNKVGFITQAFHIFDEFSVKENLLCALAITDLSLKEIEKKVDNAMEVANIKHKKNQKASKLSGGEKQRCIIARALVNDPEIILCDEPTANLDKHNTLHFLEILQKLKKMRKTIIVATHDPIFQTLKFVDNIITIKDGELE